MAITQRIRTIGIERAIALVMTASAVIFNLWLYRLEPTSKIDPNDNAFQFALVQRTDAVWSFAERTCTGITRPVCIAGYLVDHWVPNWAQGYNLPYYYSHLPQVFIVGSWRMLSPLLRLAVPSMTLFSYYHLIIYLLLSLMPVPLFVALRVIGLRWAVAGAGAMIASHISTDGFYGIDQSSFLWRGWGLSSQLFASIWFPLAVAYPIRFLRNGLTVTKPADFPHRIKWAPLWDRPYILSVIFLTATTAGHMGMGMTALITVAVIAMTPAVVALLNRRPLRELQPLVVSGIAGTAALALPPVLLLSYWIVPTMLGNVYHNTSVWDPVWKFDSYGTKEVLVNLWNGALFDFDRIPWFTGLVLVGAFAALLSDVSTLWPSLSLLFVFWTVMYFGRTTLGGVIDLIPGMSEYHQHRFIVMVQLFGLFLAPLGLFSVARLTNAWLWRTAGFIAALIRGTAPVPARIRHAWTAAAGVSRRHAEGSVLLAILAGTVLSVVILYPATIRYATWNDVLIRQANGNYDKQIGNADQLVTSLAHLPPGRVFAGRGGWWGHNFRIAETPYYMYLSTLGFPTIAWLPETWSMNSDTEQFFSEDNESHYRLYNLRYVVAPPTQPAQPFWKLIKENPSWTLYETEADGYITGGTSPTVVRVTKSNLINLVHLWIQSDYPSSLLFPTLTYREPDKSDRRPYFAMIDEATYLTPDGRTHTLMADTPVYMAKTPAIAVTDQKNDGDMAFSATVSVPSPCRTCVAVLKQTYHPQWTATVDGKPVPTFSVFPFYTAVWLPEGGSHTVVFRYGPAPAKLILMVAGACACAAALAVYVVQRIRSRKSPAIRAAA